MIKILDRFRKWANRNKPVYSAIIGGPRTFAPAFCTNGRDYNSTVGTSSGTEVLGQELSSELYSEASDLRMKLARKLDGRGDLIVKLEVYNPKI